MTGLEQFAVVSIVTLFGLAVVFQARKPYDRYTTITEMLAEPQGVQEPGTESTLRGTVQVTEPATLERAPPEELSGVSSDAALWAWRIRRKVNTGGGNKPSHWKTVEGGLGIGEFTIQHDWERVRIDTEWLRTEVATALAETDDPFALPTLYLGHPEEELPLGELNPLNKLLERAGLAGDDGILSEWEMSLSVGTQTTTPDRYQATIVSDGDELFVRGKVVETAEALALRGTEDTPLVVGTGNLETKADRFRSQALKQGAFGVLLVLLGTAAAAVAFL